MPQLDFGFGLSGDTVREITETEHHLHNYERWLGLSTDLNPPASVAEPIGDPTVAGYTDLPFVIDGGSDTWGAWVQILGSSDTPQQAGKTKYDFHRILVTTVERANAIHFVQVGYGASGAAALAAGTYTEFVYYPSAAASRAAPVAIIDKRQNAGALAWARCMVVDQATGTVNFFIGLHEYDV